MIKRISNTFFLIILFLFIFLVTKHYFSEKNKIFTGKTRTSYSLMANKGIENLPVLKNDTNNVIEFNDGFSGEIKNEKPRSFWNLLKSE